MCTHPHDHSRHTFVTAIELFVRVAAFCYVIHTVFVNQSLTSSFASLIVYLFRLRLSKLLKIVRVLKLDRFMDMVRAAIARGCPACEAQI